MKAKNHRVHAAEDERRYRKILADNNLPEPLDHTVVDMNYNMGRDDWYGKGLVLARRSR